MNWLRFISKKTTISNINKQLINKAKEIDPLVDENFYCRKLKELNINGNNVEKLYNNVDKDIIKLMALLRGCQLGVIDRQYIYDVLEIPTNVSWLVDKVQMELHTLLGLDSIEKLCKGDKDLYNKAVQKRLHGFSYEEVYDYVTYTKLGINKE